MRSMKTELRTEAQANAALALRAADSSVKIGKHFATPAPKRERKAKTPFQRMIERLVK